MGVWIGAGDSEERELVGEVEGDAAVVLAERLDAGPGDFSGSDEGVEIAGLVVGDAGGEDADSRSEAGSGAP